MEFLLCFDGFTLVTFCRYADRVKELGAADPVKNGDADMEDIQEQSVSSSADSSILVVSRREDSHSDLAQLRSLNDGK